MACYVASYWTETTLQTVQGYNLSGIDSWRVSNVRFRSSMVYFRQSEDLKGVKWTYPLIGKILFIQLYITYLVPYDQLGCV